MVGARGTIMLIMDEGGVSMLDSADSRFYALLGTGILILALCLYYAVPIEQIVAILAAFGLGGVLPSPAK